MKQKIKPSIYNSERYRKEALKKVRNTIQDSPLTKAKKKLFKVKRINNSDLYGSSTTTGEHLVLTIAIDPYNDNVATATITSLEDSQGNPTKQDQLRKGLIMRLPVNQIHNFNRKVGIQQVVITKNATTGTIINYSMLRDPLYGASIDESLKNNIDTFLFNNPQHKKSSSKNHHKVRRYIK